MKSIILLLFILFGNIAFTQAIQFTIEDRDRIIKLEEGQKSLQKQIDMLQKQIDDFKSMVQIQFTDLKNQIDDIKKFMYWGFGIIFSWIAFLIGFVLWDRRTTLAPIQRDSRELQLEVEKLKKEKNEIINVLKKYSDENPSFKDILNKAALF